MRRIAAFLALPFVLLAMLVVPLFGGHFCPQEAIPLLGGAAALPLIEPLLRRLRRQKPHCCDKEHTKFRVSATRDAQGRVVLRARETCWCSEPEWVGGHKPSCSSYTSPGHRPNPENECCEPGCIAEYPHKVKDHTS